MNKKVSKILALAMAFVLVLGIAGIALADNTFTSTSGSAYATDVVNVRSGPGTSYSILGYLSKGEKVTITGTVSNGWTQIRLPGSMLGYVSNGYLTSSNSSSNGNSNVNTTGGVFTVTAGALNIRSGPGTNYSILGVLQKGAQVTRIGQDGKWFKVAASNNADAWVSSKYLTSSSGGSSSVDDATSSTMYATTGVNVRSGPGTNNSIVGGLNRGDKVARVGKSGSWTKVTWGSGTAYVFSKYLQTSPVSGGGSNGSTGNSTGSYIRYANSLINVRSGPGESYNRLGTVGQGQSVTCVGTSGNWTVILWGSDYGYVYTGYLSTNSSGSGWNAWDSSGPIFGSNSVYMYQNAPLFNTTNSSTQHYVKSIAQGTRATLLSIESNNWAKILYDNTVYYTFADLLAYTN